MYQFLKWISAAVAKLKPETLSSVAWIIAVLFFDVLRLRRGLMLRNLTTAFGDDVSHQRKVAMARQAYYHFALTVLEVLGSDTPAIADHVRIEGEEHLKAALAEGKGAYILCCHMGNWECMGATFNRYVAPTRVVVKKVGGAATNRFVEEKRAAIGFQVIERNKPLAAIKAMQTTVREGNLVGFVMDQSRPGEPKIPFFGKPAKTNTGLATMYIRTGSPVLPAYMERRGVHQHVLHILPKISLTSTGDRDEDLIHYTTRFNQELENIIRKLPEQYFWLHNRWK